MADNKNRQALSDDTLQNVAGGYVELLEDKAGAQVIDNETGRVVATFINEALQSKSPLPNSSSRIDKGYIDAWEKANALDKKHNAQYLGYDPNDPSS